MTQRTWKPNIRETEVQEKSMKIYYKHMKKITRWQPEKERFTEMYHRLEKSA